MPVFAAAPPWTGHFRPAITASDSLLSITDLRIKLWDHYHAVFDRAVADNRAAPFVFPGALVVSLLLTFAWLVVPHVRRPRVYAARWFAMAVIVAANAEMLRWVRSPHPGFSYLVGLVASYGVMIAFNFIVWTRPQFEAARIVKRRKSPPPSAAAVATTDYGKPSLKTAGSVGRDGHDDDDDVYEYVWQPYPEGGTLVQRAGWTADLLINFRGTGWNWATSAVPRPPVPSEIQLGTPVDVGSIPLVAKGGCTRAGSEYDFVTTRLLRIAYTYGIMDCLGLSVLHDPYFLYGPVPSQRPPDDSIRAMSPWMLQTYREVFTLLIIWCAVDACSSLHDLVSFYLLSNFNPKYGELWMYPSTNGSVSAVCDHGLAGFWGSVWHQSFRVTFSAPSGYLARHGYLTKGTMLSAFVTTFIAFLLSGILHSAGSFTSLPQNAPWRSIAFFLLQGVGIVVQKILAARLGNTVVGHNRLVSQASNILFTLAWLNMTGILFTDDLASAGMWLMEPVPVSVLRLLGFGPPGEHWKRWSFSKTFRLESTGQWWERGVAI